MNIIKLFVSAFSLILIISVIISVIVAITSKPDMDVKREGRISPKRKAVSQLCAPTGFTDLCVETLNKANTSDLKELIKAMFISSHTAISKLYNLTDSMFLDFNRTIFEDLDPSKAIRDHFALLDLSECKDLLEITMVDLQKSVAIVEENQITNMNGHADDIMAKLNAVITFQKACLDGFHRETHTEKEKLMGPMQESRQLGSIALTTISNLPNHLAYFGTIKNKYRGLLHVDADADADVDVDVYKYPSWFSAADRKLMAETDWKPSVVVAKDGSGQFRRIQDAVDAYPDDLEGRRYVILVKAGVYKEQIIILPNQTNVFIYGDGNTRTYVTNDLMGSSNGDSATNAATFFAAGDGFIARNMGFANNAGPEAEKAVALLVRADKAAIIDCRVDGYQQTLFAQAYRQFYLHCIISGTVDVIFGDATAIIQDSWIIARRPNNRSQNILTAHDRNLKSQTTAFVIQNCKIFPDSKLWPDRKMIKSYLGRPLGPFATTVFLENSIEDFIDPEGYLPWDNGTHVLMQGFRFFEYNNYGPGAKTDNRVKWTGVQVIDRNQAQQFTVSALLQGGQWLQEFQYNLTLSS